MHRFSRNTGLASVGLAAVLLASGCGSGGSDKSPDTTSGKASAGAASSAPAKAPTESGGGGGTSASPSTGAPGKAAGIDGDWVAVTQGKPVALVVKGKNASVLGEHLCNGTVSSAAGQTALHLTCPDGNTTRTRGTARLNGIKLEVSWAGFGKDEFTRNKTAR
ncbi:hypothetical protein ACFXOD_37480 [Streptomyces sp. NPDC059161]|uniref:hypothetical protein n=1 Tax=Streptomyces sp. NPDC059161 TaxID=3346749 RepID=UPI003683986E